MNYAKYKLSNFLIIAWLASFWRWNCVTVISTITSISPSILNIIWLCFIAFIMIFYLYNKKIKIKNGVFAIVAMLFFYCFSLLLTPNPMGMLLFQNFIRYALLGSFLIMQIDDINTATRLYCMSSVFAFCIFGFLPFTGSLSSYTEMAFFKTGMSYGESVIVPCFLGLYTLYKEKKYRILGLLSVVCLVMGLILANRSSLLVCLFFLFLYQVWIEETDTKKILKYFLLAILLIIILYNLRQILSWLESYLNQMGIRSYAITKYNALANNEISFTRNLSGRDIILTDGIRLFKENIFTGIGFGTFYELTDVLYVHNILLDWYSTLGILGGTVMLFLTIKAIWNMFHVQNVTTKKFLLILFCLWCPRLFFSKTFADDIEYWSFLVFALSLYYRETSKAI